MDIKYMQIDQPINLGDVLNITINTPGVLSTGEISLVSRSGEYQGRQYSDASFNPVTRTKNNIVFPMDGSIFEMKFPNFDIEIVAS